VGKTYVIDPKSEYPSDLRATAFLLDCKHRLWLGADNGEWGGWCDCVDLDAGQVRSIAGQRIYEHTTQLLWLGVYGFTELRDGQVWAYGGSMHMGMTDGFIWRVDQGKSEKLYMLDNEPREDKNRRKAEEAAAKRAKEEEDRKIAAFRRDFVIPPIVDGPVPDPVDEPKPIAKAGRLPADRPYLPITHVIGPGGSLSFPSTTYTGQTHASGGGERSTSSNFTTEPGAATRWGPIPRYAPCFPSKHPARPWKCSSPRGSMA
jgi:hypothetical protein